MTAKALAMEADLCVIGLGTMGLPTAALFARAGLRVVGVDLDTRLVDAVNRGDVLREEPGITDLVAEVVRAGRLSARTTPVPAAAYIIAVPSGLDAAGKPSIGVVEAAVKSVAQVLPQGALVVIESTIPPGATERFVRPILESPSRRAGRDFFLAYCPERAIPGATIREMVENHRLVGGLDGASTDRAVALYRRAIRGEAVPTDLLSAEFAKLAENTYRDVNIALANELSRLCEATGADAWEVIRLSNLHPRVHLHQPGPGVGGYCIPIAPRYLASVARDPVPLLQASRSINLGQEERVVERTRELLASAPPQPVVAVLGLAYKGGVGDARDSPAVSIVERLVKAGITVRCHDPRATNGPFPTMPVARALDGADLLLLLVDHPEFFRLDPGIGSTMRTKNIYDTRRVLDARSWKGAGFRVETLGVGTRA